MKVGIYARVSTEDQYLFKQERACKEYCNKNNIEIYKIYSDTISGIKESRPGFNDLLEDMRKYKFDCVMVTKLDRIGRSLQHLLSIIDELRKKGVNFIAITQNINTSSAIGKFQLQVMGAFAEFERNIISERTKEGLKYAMNVGKRGKDKKERKKRGGIRKPL